MRQSKASSFDQPGKTNRHLIEFDWVLVALTHYSAGKTAQISA
jgi:hypothetical protein